MNRLLRSRTSTAVSVSRAVSIFGGTQLKKTPVNVGTRASLCSIATEAQERDQMHYDALIIGAGPAGLSSAIRLKQL